MSMPLAAPDIPAMSEWRPLARGGLSVVWEARQETLDRLVAVKVYDRGLVSDSEQRRFRAEATAAGNLSGHPGIVPVYDAGILADRRPFLVMKLCSGGSLTQWLRPENRQSAERIRSVGVRIADALATAHGQGMLHGDVKPANILIDSYGNVGLADFGLASASGSGALEGITPAYASPEVILREAPTEFSDVYQLAATLYALLSGGPPRKFSGGATSLADMRARLDDPVTPLPGVDDDLMRLLLDGLSRTPTDRPTAAEFRDRLAAIDLTERADVPKQSSADATGIKPKRKRRLALTLVAVTVLCLLAVVVAASGFYLYEIDRSVTANISRGIDLPEEGTGATKRPTKAPEAPRTLDYVVIGTDYVDPKVDSLGRNDSVMLVHLTEARDEAYVISVPRNTWVNIPGHGMDTMGNAYVIGGAPLVVRTLETLTGARMDHVAMLDIKGFAALTEDLGGVTVQNRTAFSSHGFTYPRGKITLKGDAALWYVRERRGPISESYRAENQRNVLKSIMAKGLSGEVVADPLRFTRFIGNAAKRIRVDNSLTDSELRSTAVSLRLRPGDIRLLAVPVGKERKIRGQRVRPIDPDRIAQLNDALRTDTVGDYVQKNPPG